MSLRELPRSSLLKLWLKIFLSSLICYKKLLKWVTLIVWLKSWRLWTSSPKSTRDITAMVKPQVLSVIKTLTFVLRIVLIVTLIGTKKSRHTTTKSTTQLTEQIKSFGESSIQALLASMTAQRKQTTWLKIFLAMQSSLIS